MKITALWERLDVPGYDAALVEDIPGGWTLRGTTVFRHESAPASLTYAVQCDSKWICRSGEIRGWIGAREYELVVKHDSDGTWFLNDYPVPGLQDCVDLDFGFTPATNFTHLRRLNLEIGQSVTFPVRGSMYRGPRSRCCLSIMNGATKSRTGTTRQPRRMPNDSLSPGLGSWRIIQVSGV